jgi:MFS superfamily sulfate permease-like transporter
MNKTPWMRLTGPFHLLEGIRPLQAVTLQKDVLAGITLAALAIPEVMGYTRISQTPVVTSLYTLLLPMLAFALLGASRHLVVAADSATAAILAASLASVAAPRSPEYLSLTMATAITVGILLVVAAVARLGFLADFLSRSALIGLLTGIGVQVAAGETAGLLGLEKHGAGALQQIGSALARISQAHGTHCLVVVVVLAVILGLRGWNPRLPGALIAVIGSILASWLLRFRDLGIAVVGTVPGGLPHLALPAPQSLPWNRMLLTAASCFVVILAQSAATCPGPTPSATTSAATRTSI